MTPEQSTSCIADLRAVCQLERIFRHLGMVGSQYWFGAVHPPL
jgi:hypothetical protein